MDGAGVTFLGQFRSEKHYKKPLNLNAQCLKVLFPGVYVQCYAQSDTVNSVL